MDRTAHLCDRRFEQVSNSIILAITLWYWLPLRFVSTWYSSEMSLTGMSFARWNTHCTPSLNPCILKQLSCMQVKEMSSVANSHSEPSQGKRQLKTTIKRLVWVVFLQGITWTTLADKIISRCCGLLAWESPGSHCFYLKWASSPWWFGRCSSPNIGWTDKTYSGGLHSIESVKVFFNQ